MTMLLWKTKNKATDTSTAQMWSFMRTLLPENDTMGTFSKAKTILKAHRRDTVEKIDCCPNMCVAYFNCSSTELQSRSYQNAHRSFCPKCGEKRFLPDGKTPKRYFFYLPFRHWLQDLFMKPDLHPYLSNDTDTSYFPDGDLRRSRGWESKVLKNENINTDRRHQALVASTDGVPYFKDMNSSSGWPMILRSANLPHGLWNDYGFTHLVGLVPSEFLDDKSERNKRYGNLIKRYFETILFV